MLEMNERGFFSDMTLRSGHPLSGKEALVGCTRFFGRSEGRLKLGWRNRCTKKKGDYFAAAAVVAGAVVVTGAAGARAVAGEV